MRRFARSRLFVTRILLFVMLIELFAPLGVLAQTGGETTTGATTPAAAGESSLGELQAVDAASAESEEASSENLQARQRKARFSRPGLDKLRAMAPKDEKAPPEARILNVVVEADGTMRDLSPKRGAPDTVQQTSHGELAATEEALGEVLQGGEFEIAQGGHTPGNMYVTRGGGTYYDPAKDSSDRPLVYNCFGPLDSDISS